MRIRTPVRTKLVRTPTPAPALAVVASLLSLAALSGFAAAPAAARGVDRPDVGYRMPFACGQRWTGDTRAQHSPSPQALDFTRGHADGRLVLAAAAGVVTRAADLGDVSYGRYVVVDHGDGNSTVYAHLKAIWVTTGQSVDQGAILGRVGSTGNSTGPHLHFEERVDGRDQPVWFDGTPYVAGTAQASANCPDVPVTGDWNQNGTDDVAVYRRRVHPTFHLRLQSAPQRVIRYGKSTDQPVTGDWDGDGSTDVGVRRANRRAFLLRGADGSTTVVRLGARRDVGVTGDWDGEGSTDVGVWRPATATFTLRYGDGTTRAVPLGSVGDQPVTGDWNGDGTTDLGVFDPPTATFTLGYLGADGMLWTSQLPFGSVDGLPLSGDWNGDGTSDVGVWAPATATFSLRGLAPVDSAARGTAAATMSIRFGRHR